MSRPDDRQIAQMLGVKPEKVSQLRRRGMPTGTLQKARAWFEANGMTRHTHKGSTRYRCGR